MNLFVLLCMTFAFSLLSITHLAQAQATRTWVSGVGDDANPCSRTAPCKTFAGAISKTAARGEINVLDPGGFGAVTITKSINIISDGSIAGVLTNVNSGILVNLPAATDNVLIKGLDIEGLGTAGAGIRMIGNGNLTVIDCLITDFAIAGIDIESTTGARVVVDRTTLSGSVGGVLLRSTSVPGTLIVANSQIDRNTSFAIKVDNINQAFIGSSLVAGTLNGFQTTAGGVITSFGNNILRNATPTNTTPLQ